MWKRITGLCPLLVLVVLTACRTMPMPKVNLSEPGWDVRQGQALWRSHQDAPEIAGELLAATRDGESFVQFTKTPFPFAVAQTTTNGWRAEFPTENRSFSAPGSPPARIIWFQLARALTGKPLAKDWLWQKTDAGWRLHNRSTGESLEGYFTQ